MRSRSRGAERGAWATRLRPCLCWSLLLYAGSRCSAFSARSRRKYPTGAARGTSNAIRGLQPPSPPSGQQLVYDDDRGSALPS